MFNKTGRNDKRSSVKSLNTFEPGEDALPLHLLPLSLLHALVELRHHDRLEDQDLHAANELRVFLPHEVHHCSHHGVRHRRRVDSSLTWRADKVKMKMMDEVCETCWRLLQAAAFITAPIWNSSLRFKLVSVSVSLRENNRFYRWSDETWSEILSWIFLVHTSTLLRYFNLSI